VEARASPRWTASVAGPGTELGRSGSLSPPWGTSSCGGRSGSTPSTGPGPGRRRRGDRWLGNGSSGCEDENSSHPYVLNKGDCQIGVLD